MTPEEGSFWAQEFESTGGVRGFFVWRHKDGWLEYPRTRKIRYSAANTRPATAEEIATWRAEDRMVQAEREAVAQLELTQLQRFGLSREDFSGFVFADIDEDTLVVYAQEKISGGRSEGLHVKVAQGLCHVTESGAEENDNACRWYHIKRGPKVLLVAAFGPSTGWAGKTITCESGVYLLEGHGPITPAEVLAYEGQGHILWADQAPREELQRRATASVDALSEATRRWAAGERDVTLVTRDGGETWCRQSSMNTLTLFGVAFSDASRGWAVGPPDTILATADGGASWSRQRVRVRDWVNAVAFSDSEHGWAVGEGGAICATRDGGINWVNQASGTQATLSGVAFGDASHGWAVGKAGTILATADGGATWSDQSLSSGGWLFAVACSDAAHAWAVGSASGAVIVATSDGGATWSEQHRLPQRNEHLGVAFSDATHGWVVGHHLPSWTMPADGSPWTKHSSASGTILATADGGATWVSQFSWSTEWLNAVAFIDAVHGWAVGASGTILFTTDGGETWNPQSSGCSESLYDVAFTDATHGWAVGSDGVILTTIDGGATWTGSSAWVFAQAFSDAKHGWAVGDFGVVLATSDGGRTWSAQSAEPAPEAPPPLKGSAAGG